MTSTQERQIMVALLSGLIVFGTIYFWFVPSLKTYQDKQLAVAARSKELADLDLRKADLARYDKFFTDQKLRVGRLEQAVPAEENYPELLVQTKTIAEQTGLTLTNFQPARSESGQREFLVTLTVRGSYPHVLAFTESIEKNLRPGRIQTLNFVRSGQTNRNTDLAATLQIRFVELPHGGAA